MFNSSSRLTSADPSVMEFDHYLCYIFKCLKRVTKSEEHLFYKLEKRYCNHLHYKDLANMCSERYSICVCVCVCVLCLIAYFSNVITFL